MESDDLENRLNKLPTRAIVAFATRCAQRVEPLFSLWEGASPEDTWYLDLVNSNCRLFARGFELGYFHNKIQIQSNDSQSVAAAAMTAAATAAAVRSVIATSKHDCVLAAKCARANAANAAVFFDNTFDSNAQNDLKELEELVRDLDSDQDRENFVVSNDFFEKSLWSEFPEWWERANQRRNKLLKDSEKVEPSRVRISFEINENLDTEPIVAELENLIRGLNKAHIASGGEGLSEEDWHMFIPANLLVET